MGASTADEQYSASIAGFYDNPGTSFIIKTAGTYANQSTVAERLRVDNMMVMKHINSTSPKAKLDINGTLNVSGVATATSFVPTTGQLSHRNIIVNGDMNVPQKGNAIYI